MRRLDSKFESLQTLDLVTKARRLLELQIRGRSAHSHLQVSNAAAKILADEVRDTAISDWRSRHKVLLEYFRIDDTHSNAYICAHGDDTDYHTIQACDRKDRAEDAGN